jgi:hypothetical protein
MAPYSMNHYLRKYLIKTVKTIHYKKKSNMLILLEITLSELAKAIEINNETNIENSSSTFH